MCSVVAIMNYDNLQSSYYFQLMSTYHCSLGICERLCKSIIFSFVPASPCPVGIGLLALRTDTLFTPAPKRDRSFYLCGCVDWKLPTWRWIFIQSRGWWFVVYFQYLRKMCCLSKLKVDLIDRNTEGALNVLHTYPHGCTKGILIVSRSYTIYLRYGLYSSFINILGVLFIYS